MMGQRWRSGRLARSLVTRIILFGIGLVLLGTGLRYFLLSAFLREDLTRVVSAQQLALAQAVARDVDYKLEERRRLLERLAAGLLRPVREDPLRLQAWLAERHAAWPLFSLGLMVVDREGRVLRDAPAIPGRAGGSLVWNADFQAALAGRALIGRPRLGPLVSRPVLPMLAPIRAADGRVDAVLIGVTALDAADFLDRIREPIGTSGGFLLVSPTDRLYVAAGDPAMVLRATPVPGVNPLLDQAMAGYRGTGVSVNAQGVEEIAAMAAVPSTGWFVVARLPTAEAWSAITRAQAFVLRGGLLSACILILVAGAAMFWLLRPLYRAAALADRMTQGDVPPEALPVERDDEVGHLTAAFNRLLVKLAESRAELEHLARHDPLTGLPNRALLADRLDQALARSRRDGRRLALLFLDLDGFKPINDSLGHKAGDEVLRQIALRLRGLVRQTDTVARVGGDEFVLLATDLEADSDDGARALAEKCIRVVAEPLDLQGQRPTLGVSVGVAPCTGHCDPERLLVAADQAMYAAKQQGRGRYVMAPPCATCAAVTLPPSRELETHS